MPRAKVRDEDRQRARKACIPCKTSKTRCDANQPCSNCIRKDCRSACQYLDSSERVQEQPYRPTKVPRLSDGHTSPTSLNASRHADGKRHEPLGSRKTQRLESMQLRSPSNASAPSPEVTHSRMLLSSKGEKMYIGKFSTLSLLQFLRQTVRFHVGPSAFSETDAKNVMLEVDIHDAGHVEIEKEGFDYKQSLIQSFLEVSSGFLDIYTETEAYSLLSRSTSVSQRDMMSVDDQAVLYLLMAIGGQCRGLEPSDLAFATTCFSRARILAFEGLLCDPSINMVRVFLLMSFYMLGACRRNAAFMYLGVAGKAACALGLHSTSQHQNLSKVERTLRVKTWKSLYVLDTLVNSLLGRPGTLPLIKPELFDQKDERPSRQSSPVPLDAAYGACVHIATIVPNASKNAELDPSATETFLESLGRWRETALPTHRKYTFGLASLPALETLEQQIGNLHVACIYYYAVILVTKPFLLSHLTYKLRKQTTDKSGVQTPTPLVDERIGKLGQACVDAASYMTQLCEKMMHSDGLKDNMCILKALMFAAGLLLGYSNFVDGKASESEHAFQAAQAVLKKFSTLSPQARHYYEILQDFDHAIAKQQQLQQERRRRTTVQYVKPIFSIESSQDTEHTAYPTPSTGVGYSINNATVSSNAADNNSYAGSADFTDVGGFDINTSMAFGLGDAELDSTMTVPLFWDDSTFDWQLFSAFPDEVHIGM